MPTIRQLITGEGMNRRQKLFWHIGVPLGVVALGIGGPIAHNAADKDYGCASTNVLYNETTLNATDALKEVLDLPNTPSLRAVVAEAAINAPGAGQVDAGDQVKLCVDNNPLSLSGFGSSGWSAEVTVQHMPNNVQNIPFDLHPGN